MTCDHMHSADVAGAIVWTCMASFCAVLTVAGAARDGFRVTDQDGFTLFGGSFLVFAAFLFGAVFCIARMMGASA